VSGSERGAYSPILFHGPTAQTRASMAAADWGRVVGVFGDPNTGINAETARAVVAAASTPYVGDGLTALIVGPVDLGTSDGVNDPMLKVLEEPDPMYPRVHLWAWDEGEVRPTIRSRCLAEWCPGRWPSDGAANQAARAIVRAYVAKDTAAVLDAMQEVQGESWSAPAVFRALAADLAPRIAAGGPDVGRIIELWHRVRAVTGTRAVPWHEAVAAVLP
jgi:hypothetical protein